MDYNTLMQRYWRAETSAAEERELHAWLSGKEQLSDEERAALMMLTHTRSSQPSISIKLHQSKPRYWQMALAAGLCSLAVFCTIKFTEPTVYGYYNGEPITSFAEAQSHAEQMFANLSQAEMPSEEELMKRLFTLE